MNATLLGSPLQVAVVVAALAWLITMIMLVFSIHAVSNMRRPGHPNLEARCVMMLNVREVIGALTQARIMLKAASTYIQDQPWEHRPDNLTLDGQISEATRFSEELVQISQAIAKIRDKFEDLAKKL